MKNAEMYHRLIINKMLDHSPDMIQNLHASLLLVLAGYVYYYKFNQKLYPEPIIYKKYGPRVNYISDGYYGLYIDAPITKYCTLEFQNLAPYFKEHIFSDSLFDRKELTIIENIVQKHHDKTYWELIETIELYEKALGSRLSELEVLGVLPQKILNHNT